LLKWEMRVLSDVFLQYIWELWAGFAECDANMHFMKPVSRERGRI